MVMAATCAIPCRTLTSSRLNASTRPNTNAELGGYSSGTTVAGHSPTPGMVSCRIAPDATDFNSLTGAEPSS